MIVGKKRLCIVTTCLVVGGAETQIVALATELRSRGWTIEIVSLLQPKAFVNELESAGIRIHNLNMNPGVPNLVSLFRMISIIRQFGPAVVHSHLIHANILSRIARPFMNVPVLICTAHSIHEGGYWLEKAYRLSDSMCDLTTQVCQSGLDRYTRIGIVPKDKIRFIPNGINVNRFMHDAVIRNKIRKELQIDDKFVWLAVGSFQDVKDHTNLIHAFAKIQAVESMAFLLLVGDGHLRHDIEHLVISLGLAERVRFLGIRSDISAIMNAADAYVMSSKFEGMPIVLLEASSAGLPILATRVGGIPEIVQDGISGMLVSAESSTDLANGLVSMMNLPTQDLKQMGQDGKNFTRSNYHLVDVVDRWELLYSEFLSKKGIA